MSRLNGTCRRVRRGLGVAVMLALGPLSTSAHAGQYSGRAHALAMQGITGRRSRVSSRRAACRRSMRAIAIRAGCSTGNEPHVGSVHERREGRADLEVLAGTGRIGVEVDRPGTTSRLPLRTATVGGGTGHAALADLQCAGQRRMSAARACSGITHQSQGRPTQAPTRIVQRVTCVAGKGQKSCSGSGSNFVQTLATRACARRRGRSVGLSVVFRRRLGRGEWVRYGP